ARQPPRRHAPRRRPPFPLLTALLVSVAVLVASPVRSFATMAARPTVLQDIRPLLQDLRPRLQPGDQVWVQSSEAAPVDYYAYATGVIPDRTVFDTRPGLDCNGDRD